MWWLGLCFWSLSEWFSAVGGIMCAQCRFRESFAIVDLEELDSSWLFGLWRQYCCFLNA